MPRARYVVVSRWRDKKRRRWDEYVLENSHRLLSRAKRLRKQCERREAQIEHPIYPTTYRIYRLVSVETKGKK